MTQQAGAPAGAADTAGARRRGGPRSPTMWAFFVGLGSLGAGALYELLYRARGWKDGALVFAARSAGVSLTLGGRLPELFTFASVGAAALALGLALVVARRAVASAGGRWRRAVFVLVCAAMVSLLPLHFVVSWVVGESLYAMKGLDASWARPRFVRDFGLVAPQELFFGAAIVALGSFALSARVGRALARTLGAFRRVPLWALVAAGAAVVVVLSAWTSLGLTGGLPLQADAQVYWFQAKTFAAGRLSSPLLGGREFFDTGLAPASRGAPFAFAGNRWFSVATPFAPLCFAAGIVSGVPWLVGPVLGGALVAATYFLGLEAYGRRCAAVGALVLAASPWLILMSADYLTHVPGALVGTMFLALALTTFRTRRLLPAALAGLCLGLGANARPVTAVGLCVPTALVWVAWLVRSPRSAWRPTAAFAAGLATPLAGLLVYNWLTTGHPLVFGYQAAGFLDPSRRAADLAEGWRWTPALGLSNVAWSLYGLQRAGLGWPVPWLGMAIGLLALVRPDGRVRGVWLLFLATILSLALAYSWHGRAPFAKGGPRYVFEVLPVAIVLLAVAIVWLADRLVAGGFRQREIVCVGIAVVLLCTGHAAWRTVREQLPRQRKLARDQRQFLNSVAAVEKPAVVFVPLRLRVYDTWLFNLAVSQNSPGLDGPVVFARDLGPRNRLLLDALPGRRAYVWSHDEKRAVPLRRARSAQGAKAVGLVGEAR